MRMEATFGRKSKLPTDAGAAMNSMVTSRLGSTASWTADLPALASALPMPAALHRTSYKGTSAQPNRKLPAVMIRRDLTSLRLARLFGPIGSLGSIGSISDDCDEPAAR